MRKVHEARQNNVGEVVVWGRGAPRREFLYCDEMADACVYLLENIDKGLPGLFNEVRPPLVNIGCGEDLTIRELAETITDVVGYKGKLVFDASKPDGTMRKLLDVSRMQSLGWKASVSLREGIAMTYKSYLESL